MCARVARPRRHPRPPAGAIMSIDETLMCSFHILKPAVAMESLSPINDRRPTGLMGGAGARRPATPMPPPGKR